MTLEISTAELHGAQHGSVAQLAAISESRVAITLSRGGANKTYEHTDPNEDSAGFAIGPSGYVAVVADGHTGCDAARVATAFLLRDRAPVWTANDFAVGTDWEDLARDAISGAHSGILASVTQGARATACTTLSFALWRPVEQILAFGSIGDSHIFRTGSVEAVDLALHAEPHAHFLGVPADDRASLVDKCVVGVEQRPQAHAVVLATDGLSERGIGVDVPEITVFDCVAQATAVAPEIRALTAARSVAEAASDAHRQHRSGDNIATAAIWLNS
jgi:hypothetical protein